MKNNELVFTKYFNLADKVKARWIEGSANALVELMHVCNKAISEGEAVMQLVNDDGSECELFIKRKD